MRKAAYRFITGLALVMLTSELTAAEKDVHTQKATTAQANTEPFTGRITRNRVRMRAGADLNSPILRELTEGTLVGVVSEEDTFYAIKPPKDIKAFVYRTYILDNVVDAVHVNVRLEPSLEAPIVVQLNKGDRVEGTISRLNSRWLEISIPDNVHFYIAKNFVENAGTPDLLDAQRQEIPTSRPVVETVQNNAVTREPVDQHTALETAPDSTNASTEPLLSDRMSAWVPKENQITSNWLSDHPEQTVEDFYSAQLQEATQIRGIIQPYARPVKNKPGNYLLLSHHDNQPMAFLYSTKVDLQGRVGQVVNVVVTPRANNDFAFPAYFVLTVE